MTLTGAFPDGQDEKQGHPIDVVSEKDKDIHFFQGCLPCQFGQDGHCVIQGDMNGLLDETAVCDSDRFP